MGPVVGDGSPDEQGSDTRGRILEELRRAERPLHPGDLAVLLDLHVSTVRRHLEVLETSGAVERTTEHREDPGRPRIRYRCVTSAVEGRPVCDGYRFVAEALTRWIESRADDPEAAAREIGDAWARHLVNAPPFTQTDREMAIARLFDLLDSMGYGPNRVVDDGHAIELGRCPFRQLSAEHPAVGCGLHIGIIRGALANLGAEVGIGGFTAEPGRPEGICRVELVLRGRRAAPRS